MHKIHPLRKLGVLTAAAACLSSVALGTAGAASSPPGFGHPSSALCAGKTYTIGVDIYSQGESFATSTITSIKAAASATGCVTVNVLVDNASAATALSNIQTFIQEKVSGVILANVIPSADPGIISALAAAKIPLVGTFIPAGGSTTFIDENDFASGRSGGVALAKNFVKLHPHKMPYLILGGFPEAGGASVARMNGVKVGVQAVIKKLPSSHILLVDTMAVPSTAYTATANVLGRIPKGSQILFSGINDENTNAMYEALKAGGRAKVSSGMGLGGDASGVHYICSEKSYYGSVAFFPETWGNYLVPGVLDLVQGQTLPANYFIATTVITRANVKKVYPFANC